MSGISTPISDSGSIVDIIGTIIVFSFIIIIFVYFSSRKKKKEETRHYHDKPEIWDINE